MYTHTHIISPRSPVESHNDAYLPLPLMPQWGARTPTHDQQKQETSTSGFHRNQEEYPVIYPYLAILRLKPPPQSGMRNQIKQKV
jgi:hypothetical protein